MISTNAFPKKQCSLAKAGLSRPTDGGKGLKKTFWVLTIISAVYVVIIIPIILIAEHAIIGWDVILIEIAVIIFLMFLVFFISNYKMKKISECFKLKKFDETLILCKKILKWNLNFSIRQNVYLFMAIIYFEKNDDLNFESAMKHIEDKRYLPTKFYWQTLYFLTKGNLEEAKANYQRFLASLKHIRKREAYATHESLLKSIFAYIDTKNEEAISNIKNAIEKASLSRTKNYFGSFY